MSEQTATAANASTSEPQEENYEDLFNELVDSNAKSSKYNSESDEDTVDAEESDESDDDVELADGLAETDPDEQSDDPKQNTPDGWEKRYKDLQSYSDKRLNAVISEKSELEARLQALEQAQRPVTEDAPQPEPKQEFDVEAYLKSLPEEDRELFEDNPSLLKVMTDVTSRLVPKSTIDEAKVAELVAKQFEERQANEQARIEADAAERAKDRVRQAIPEVEDIVSDREFQIWKADNQTRVTDILDRAGDDAEGVINVIRYYQSINDMQNSRESAKRSAAKGTAGASKGKSTRPSAKPDENDYSSAFEFYAQGRK